MAPANSSAATALARNGPDAKPSAAEARAQTAADAKTAAADTIRADICVIGAGSGGLAVAAAAAALGQRVVLIEKHKMGGDSLNYGCVPSKALIAAARRAHQMRTADRFGISPVHPAVDHRAVHDHVQDVIASIAPNDSVDRFAGLGVRVILGAARFIDKATVEAGDARIRARRFVIATGSSPAVPPIAGLDSAPFFTNETIFDYTRRIDRLIVIGGGPIGLELAQALLRLGSAVTVIEEATALGREDPELAAIALRNLRADGIDIREGAKVLRVEATGEGIRVAIDWNGAETSCGGTHLLLAAGRRPNIADLNLSAAGIKTGPKGIIVGKGLKTSNRRVYAIGDVAGGAQSTHGADYQAGIVVRRALFRLRSTADEAVVPRVVFVDPELAWVGLSEDEARAARGRLNVLRSAFSENDRARAERTTEGHIKVITDKDGAILGAGIVGPQAAELIQLWALAISQKLNIKAMSEWVAAYPTLSDVSRRAALQGYVAKAGNPMVRFVVRLLGRFG